ncbi:endolytic transglycosylase MltG [Fictibacillus terranigra]|uniref:Endolytic murein transglycosylase n=1 Tax=Fictibacillus terranigra TaxID=3058424 RepID=A0ABT8E4F3_9BACL|nr:endolytic transglycosylase MltG [Fictibacillus sp. CENA-BCM004]MDN4072785.1 endolytic transglycosylase MltG [Fictibacillus sp. CENA-BCM004]
MLILNTVSGDPLDSGRKNKKKKTARVLLLIFVLIAAGAVYGYTYIKDALGPSDPNNDKKITVDIPIGSSVSTIGRILESKGLITSSLVFQVYAKYKESGNLQAGVYDLKPSMNVDQLIAALKNGKVFRHPETSFTIPEGFIVPQIAETVAKNTGQTKEQVMKIMNDRAFVKQLQAQFPIIDNKVYDKKVYYPLEGYLFPAKYEFDEKQPDVKAVVKKMLDKTQRVMDTYHAQLQKSKKKPYEVLTLASMIEEEAQRPEDRPKISGVFYNRLKKKMTLDSDPTVKYARKNFKVQLLYKELKFDSPYNTYKYPGLPIGPVASPGEQSIKAALNPQPSGYYFFYARPNGQVIYTKTYKEHTKIVQKYRNEWQAHVRKS